MDEIVKNVTVWDNKRLALVASTRFCLRNENGVVLSPSCGRKWKERGGVGEDEGFSGL